MADWLPILESTELGPLLTSSAAGAAKDKAPSGPGRQSATPAARVNKGRGQAGADLFAAAANAGADDDDAGQGAPMPAARPPTGAMPVAGTDETKPTGARNENSVLFSLDALKAGFSGPAPTKPEPAPRKGSAAARSAAAAADDPFGLGSVAPSMGGGGAMFSLADNSALLTAPAPPEPPKPKVVESFHPAGASVGPEQPGSKKVVIALSVLLVLVIGGGAAALSINSKNKEAELAAAAASASAAILQAREEEQKAREAAEKAREEKRLEEERAKAAEEKAKAIASGEKPSASAAPGAGASAAPGAAGGTPKPGTPATPGTPSTSTTKQTKEPPKEEPKAAAPASDQPFSKAAAVSALGAAAGGAGSCKKLGGPTGSGRVTVTFAPSGRVTTANVEGAPFAGTSVGGCVASLFRKAHIPPFSGNAVTVSKGFTIN